MRTLARAVLAVSLLALPGLIAAADALTIYVAPNGNDAWSGTLAQPNAEKCDGPVASLAGARDALRKLRAGKAPDEPVRVLVAEGRYTMTEPLTLAPEDGGTEDAPVTLRGRARRPARLQRRTRNHRLPRRHGRPVGRRRSRTSPPASGTSSSSSSTAAGPCARARRTSSGSILWTSRRRSWPPTRPPSAPKRPGRPSGSVPRTSPASRSCTPDELKDVNLVVYHNWDNTRRFIDSLDPQEHAVVTSGEGMKPWNPWRKDSTLVLENFKARARCARRVVPRPRRHAVLQAAAGRGHGQGRGRRARGREVRSS